MKIQELLEERRTDEFVQALAPLAGAAVRGIGAAAGAVGNAVKTGAQAVGNAATTGANAVGNGVKQLSNIKNTVGDLKGILQQAGGTGVDTNKLTQALATQAPGQQLDPATMKSLQGMIPALADAMKNPQSAAALKQALTTGVKTDNAQQTQQQTQQPPGSVGTTGSASNTVAPT